MKHLPERIKELIALDAYDELDDAEREELAAALRESQEARAYAEAMRRDLGSLAGSEEAARRTDELDPTWPARLRESIERERRSSRRWAPITVAASAVVGFAAGVVFMIALGTSPPAGDPADPSGDAPRVAFERDTAPPPAQTAGTLARLGEYLGR